MNSGTWAGGGRYWSSRAGTGMRVLAEPVAGARMGLGVGSAAPAPVTAAGTPVSPRKQRVGAGRGGGQARPDGGTDGSRVASVLTADDA
ncbi:MAG: hypothetical protein ACYCO3_16995 [Mycobacteriales bacterium]